MDWTLLFLALLPSIVIACYVYWQDRHDPEPHFRLLMCFFLGALSTIPALGLELFWVQLGSTVSSDMLTTAVYAFWAIAFSEELAKYVILRYYIYGHDDFDEPMDGIVYAVMISMGFAALENVIYVMEGGASLAILRMFTAVPAHAAFAVVMGYYVGLAKFEQEEKRTGLLIRGLVWATIVHGAYDFFLFQQNFKVLTLMAFVILAIAILFGHRLMHLHVKDSETRNKVGTPVDLSDNLLE